MKLHVALSACVLLAVALVLGAALEKSEKVELARLSEATWDRFVPEGKEVDAIYGDYVLRNRHLTAVVAQPKASRKANMTVKEVAGALIDLTVRDAPGDQLSAFYPGRRKYPFRAWSAAADGGETDLEVKQVVTGDAAAVTVRAEAANNRPAVEVTYRLEAAKPYLTMTSTFTNTGGEPLTVPLEDDIRADGGKEDMVKSDDGVTDLFWIHDRFWEQAYGVVAPGGKIQSDSNSRQSVLKYRAASGKASVTLEPGESFTLERHVFPGRNLLDVRAIAEQRRGRKLMPVTMTVTGPKHPVPRARIELSRDGRVLGSGTTDAKGRLQASLAPGEYRANITTLGITLSDDSRLRVQEKQPTEWRFAFNDYRPGRVEAEITDDNGRHIPCKVQFTGKDGTPTPDFGPETAITAVKNLRYAPRGRFVEELPAGRYDVIVSRGPEYDAVFTELTVPPGESVALTETLKRSVQTPGWVSSDFHSHSSPSGDNTSSQRGRVINLACEHVEFAPCTEHNRLSTYRPHIEALGLGEFMASTTGIELTGSPLPLNHQNAFPLELKPGRQDGGAPQIHPEPEKQIERLAGWDDNSEKLVQQNHPDIGWLFYDRDGDGESDSGYERGVPFMEAIEIHPLPTALNLEPYQELRGRKRHNRVFNWLQLLNQGFRIPGVVNTDAHYNFHGSGGRRNWIQSSTDDPAQIDTLEMVRAAEQGRMVMSNGPYLEVTMREAGAGEKKTVTAGEDLPARSGRVALDVRVQCPNWCDVDEVSVLVNGRRHKKHHYTRRDDPDRFRSGTVKFDERLSLKLESDAHVVVVAGGRHTELGPVLGPSWGQYPPTAMANPVFVDVDGGGFQPNGDTLGHPLPVKYGTREGEEE